MAFSLVGSVGTVLTGSDSAAVTPAWGVGESRAAGNLLVAWVMVRGGASFQPSKLPITPTGWTLGQSVLNTSPPNNPAKTAAAFYYREAAGGDPAPTFAAVSGGQITAQLAEFAGVAAGDPIDQGAGLFAGSVTSPRVITAPGVDAGAGELCVYLGWATDTTGATATRTLAHAVNNGVVENDTNNNSDSTAEHYALGWGITNSDAAATSDSFSYSGSVTNTRVTVLLQTFKQGVTYIDAPALILGLALVAGETFDNRIYDEQPNANIALAIAISDFYQPPVFDYPPATLFVELDAGDELEFADTPTFAVALKETAVEIIISDHRLLVREKPPIRLAIDILTPAGGAYRWGIDEPAPENRPGALSFSTTMPGGFEQLATSLPRRSERDYADLAEFSTITVRTVGGQVVWQGRLETAPRSSGEQLEITPGAVGWQAALDDNQAIRALYVHRALNEWQDSSVQRRLDYLATNVDVQAGQIAPDTGTALPALGITFQGPWSQSRVGEMWFDARRLPIGSIYGAWYKNANITGTGWGWGIALSDDDRAAGTSFNASTLTTTSPGSATVTATDSNRAWGCVHVESRAANTNEDGKDYSVYFTCLAVYGTHGLPKQGTESATDAKGLLASDIVAHAVQSWCPQLQLSTGLDGTVQPSSFVIPHASWLDVTTVSQIVRDCTRFNLEDWAVWEGPTFWWAPRNHFGRRWRATVSGAGLSSTGPQVQRLWNSVIVQFQDVSGQTRTIGPPGSGANSEDAALQDNDPLNPVTAAGLQRRSMLSMGVSTASVASSIGQVFLNEQKLLSTAGEASLVGFVSDDHGVVWPASEVRAGDQISFTDAADSSYRRIVKTSYDDSRKTNQVSLDSPAEGLQALLERLNVVLVPIGV